MVIKLLMPLLFLFAVACSNQNKTKETVFPEKYQKPDVTGCSTESIHHIQNKFLVTWSDGRITTERSENSDLFVEKFLEPNLDKIKHVEFDKKVRLLKPLSALTNGPLSNDPLWGQKLIGAPAAWSRGVKGKDVVVAVIDTAIDYTHPLLKNQFIKGWDYVSDSSHPGVSESMNPHATHVAGIIAGQEGVADIQGVAPESKILGISFLDDQGGGDLSDGITAMKFAADHGAKIINNSWGGIYCSQSMKTVMEQMEQKGVFLVVAAGNEGNDLEYAPEYPAAFNTTGQITVAAGNVFDIMAGFSNHSWNLVHLAAPGEGIYSSVPGGYYEFSGTSMAAPFVSGAAALLLGIRPLATPLQLKQALLASVDVKKYRVLTQGRLNIEKAIQEIQRIIP